MRFFFRSHRFKVMVAVTAAVLVVAILAGIISASVSPINGVFGAITASVQGVAKKCSDGVNDLFVKIHNNEKLMEENAALKEKVNELTDKLTDYDEAVEQNALYEKYLGIKEQNQDFVLQPATLISRNEEDPYGSFTINKGSLQGIEKYDPVITDEGLVGYVTEVNGAYCKVTTVLDSAMSCGGLDRRTSDTGVISGEINLAEEGKTRLNSVLRSSGVAVGDYIVTSGGGVFPSGITIGEVESIHNDQYNTALFAVVVPTVNFAELRDVMVITYFNGQGEPLTETAK